jgi:DNA-binding YbaB/EbfC family protein
MAKGGFRGMPGGMNQAAMMRQVQKMQQEAIRMQEEMENKTYTSAAGGGVVSATVNGKHEIVSLDIKPEAVDPDDVEMLQDLVMAAINEAMRQMEELIESEMNKITGGLGAMGGGLGIPGL